MATYVNNLRLKEITTGDEDGTWGTSTNTNLELITDGFSYGTKEMAADANETFTMPDASADSTRSFYLKITSAVSLTATREVTLGPNTISKVWMIENATSGSQIITIKQGSGATVNVPNGSKVMVVTDGAGAGAAVLNANPTEVGGTVTSVGGTGTVNGITLTGTVTSSGNLTLGGALTGVNLTTQVTGTLPVANGGTGVTSSTGTGSVVLSTNPTFAGLTTTADMNFGDSDKAVFGAGNDLQIYHDGSNSYIQDAGSGNLYLRQNGTAVIIDDGTNNLAAFNSTSGESALYYGSSGKKLATTATGIDVTGVITTDGIDLGDSEIARFGAGNDLQIYHDGSNSYIEDSGAGNLVIRGTSLILEDAGGHDYIAMTDTGTGGTVEIKHNAVTKLATITTGIDVTGTVQSDSLSDGSGVGKINYDSSTFFSGAFSDEVTALGNTGTAVTIDCDDGNVFTATLTGNCTFTLASANSTANRATSFTLVLTNDATASRTVAFAGGTFKYPGGSVSRTTDANATDIWFFFSPDNGTTWYVTIPMKNLTT
jgi:hypothetical protein